MQEKGAIITFALTKITKTMTKSNQFFLTFLFLVFFYGVNAQKNQQQSAVPNTITQQQFDSLYHALMTAKYPEYADWKKGLPKRKRKTLLKHSIAGFLVGSLLGTSLSTTGSAFCQTIEALVTPLIQQEPQACKPKIVKAILITGSIGLTIGITASQVKSKKISRFQPTILN